MANLSTPELKDEKEALIQSESDPGTESDLELDSESEKPRPEPQPRDPSRTPDRFHQPAPSPLKRAALIVFTVLLFWLAFSMRRSLLKEKRSPKVIYATRYSKEHKFRPAASPVITETLKDGRIRIRGAGPTATPESVKPTPIAKKMKRKTKEKRKVKSAARKPQRK